MKEFSKNILEVQEKMLNQYNLVSTKLLRELTLLLGRAVNGT